MLGDRLIATGGAKLVGWLAIACLVLVLLLILSGLGHWAQFKSTVKVTAGLGQQLAKSEAQGAADLGACAAKNANVTATVGVLGDELHACRGAEQQLNADLRKALQARDKSRQAAAREAQQKREAIEAIVRRDAMCSRPVCRALSDELLGNTPHGDAE